MTARTLVALTAWVLAAGCLERGRTPGPEAEGETTVAPSETPTVSAPRTSDADPKAVQDALDTIVRLPVTQLARQPMTTQGPPFLDFVVFKAKGADYCAAYLPAERRSECNTSEGLTWEMQEVLGFAIVAFDDPAAPRVTKYRFVGESSLIPTSREILGEVIDANRPPAGSLTHIALESLSADDIDGDGVHEYVVRVSHDSLSTNSEEGPGAVYETFFHKRLMVFREDLSLQADGYVHQYWHADAPGWSLDNHRVSEHYEFARPASGSTGALIVEWCELDPTVEECPLEVLCDRPTERVVVAYDPASDSYPAVKHERLRPAVQERDEERCP